MPHSPTGTYRSHRRSRDGRAKRWALALVVATALGLITWPVLDHFGVFSDNGEPISFEQNQQSDQGGDSGRTADRRAQPSAGSGVSMPTGPTASFTIAGTVPEDGSKIAVTKLTGKKSGFTGKVWVWVPPQYKDPKYAHSGFPVMIALPGGAGYPVNYWMGTDLHLESSISQWSKEGKSLPFILAMPVLNPHGDDDGTYWDASDIPGQPKMGTWLTEDVPNLIKANFRTFKSRDGWAFMGSSTGGFAGLKSVLQHPDRFKAVIASGPDVVPDSRLWAGHPAEKAANNPDLLAEKLIQAKGPQVYLALQVGTTGSDAQTLPKVRKFANTHGKGPIKTKFSVIQGGGHNAHTYVPNMVNGGLIQWISAHMRGPVAAS
ncbi:alpha/beta hydrolase-fold protein [Streptomyces sp. NPDC005209]|uniref:alpha/beta hydrolase n=1 Tax=Streptomyces sp. NPDC005209 TaxID=3156715 RepID=UPI00339F4CA2